MTPQIVQCVSKSIRQASPALARGLLLGGLVSLSLLAAGCGGGSSAGGSTSTSTGSDGGGSGSGGGAGGGTGGGTGGTGGGGTGGSAGGGTGGGTGGSDGSSGGGTGGGSTGGGSTGGTGNSGQSNAPVIYVADQDVYERYELYKSDASAPGGSVKLNGALPAGGTGVDLFTVANGGTSVVYTADANTASRTELYLVNVANPGAPVRLNTPLGANRDVIDYAVSPDGTRVVYRADQDVNDVFELYLVDVAHPGVSTKLSAPLTVAGWVRTGFSFSPDGLHVVYRADQDVADRLELYMVDVASPGVSKKVNPALGADRNVYTAFGFSPDSKSIAYVADQDTDETLELYAVATASPGTSKKLNGTLVAGGDVCRFRFSPDSKRVAYCADQDVDDVLELYTVALDTPGQSVKVNPPLVSGGKVTTGYEFSPDSSFIIYAANQENATRTDMYRADVATLGSATRLNPTLVAGGNVTNFRLSPDGLHVGYVANQDDAAVFELYEVDLQTPGTATKVSAPMKNAGLFFFEYASDGKQMTYLADQDSDASEVYRVDLTTPAVSTRLNGSLVAGGEVWDFTLAQ